MRNSKPWLKITTNTKLTLLPHQSWERYFNSFRSFDDKSFTMAALDWSENSDQLVVQFLCYTEIHQKIICSTSNQLWLFKSSTTHIKVIVRNVNASSTSTKTQAAASVKPCLLLFAQYFTTSWNKHNPVRCAQKSPTRFHLKVFQYANRWKVTEVRDH